jgi:hypothetical protein
MWFMAWYGWSKKNSADGLAWSDEDPFPMGWRKYGKNPIPSIGEFGTYDALLAGKPSIFRTCQRHYDFYTDGGCTR